MKNIIFAILLSIALLGCEQGNETASENTTEAMSSPTREALLIGTFHYNNPGADVAKTRSFDILNEGSQGELQQIASAIAAYRPGKIFVEWPHNEQPELDSLYELYLNGKYFSQDSLSDFYRKNEIFQLAFRVARESHLETVYAIDYATSFPFGEVMQDIENSDQTELKEKIEGAISRFTVEFDSLIDSGASLTELTYFLNTPEMRRVSNDLHNNLMLQAGEFDDFSGPFLTAEWYKRNLYMWSMIRKKTEAGDERIMVLAGASHVAMFELFMRDVDEWKTKELKEILENG